MPLVATGPISNKCGTEVSRCVSPSWHPPWGRLLGSCVSRESRLMGEKEQSGRIQACFVLGLELWHHHNLLCNNLSSCRICLPCLPSWGGQDVSGPVHTDWVIQRRERAYLLAWRFAVALKLKGDSAFSVEDIKRLGWSAFVQLCFSAQKIILAGEGQSQRRGWL